MSKWQDRQENGSPTVVVQANKWPDFRVVTLWTQFQLAWKSQGLNLIAQAVTSNLLSISSLFNPIGAESPTSLESLENLRQKQKMWPQELSVSVLLALVWVGSVTLERRLCSICIPIKSYYRTSHLYKYRSITDITYMHPYGLQICTCSLYKNGLQNVTYIYVWDS